MRAWGTSIAAWFTVATTLAVPQPAQASSVTTQVIPVKASSYPTTYASLEAWTRTMSGAYRRVAGPWRARVGYRGLAEPGQRSRETVRPCPAGTGSPRPFGVAGDPGTAMPYFTVDDQDWWVSDTRSRYYNRHYRCAPGTCPVGTFIRCGNVVPGSMTA